MGFAGLFKMGSLKRKWNWIIQDIQPIFSCQVKGIISGFFLAYQTGSKVTFHSLDLQSILQPFEKCSFVYNIKKGFAWRKLFTTFKLANIIKNYVNWNFNLYFLLKFI